MISNFKYKRIDTYITKKFLGTFFYSIALIIIIVIIFDISEKIDDFLEKDAPLSEIIFTYYVNFIPYFVNLFSPLFTFIAVIYFTSKLANNTEIIAVLSSGVSYYRLLRPFIYSAIFLALFSFMLSNFIIPAANKKRISFEMKYIKNPLRSKDVNIHMQISPGGYAYAEHFNSHTNTAYNFSLERITEKGLVYKINSEIAKWDSTTGSWKIENYYVRTIDSLKETLSYSSRLDTTINLKPSDFIENLNNIATMNWGELNKYIANEKLKGSDYVSHYLMEKHRRIASPFATVVLTLIGVSLSSRKLRGGIGLHLGFGIALSFSFIMFMQISSTFATSGNLPPVIAAWIPNIIFGALGIYLLRIAPK